MKVTLLAITLVRPCAMPNDSFNVCAARCTQARTTATGLSTDKRKCKCTGCRSLTWALLVPARRLGNVPCGRPWTNGNGACAARRTNVAGRWRGQGVQGWREASVLCCTWATGNRTPGEAGLKQPRNPEGGPRREKPGEGDEGASAHLWGEQEKGQEAVDGRVRYPGDLWETSGP